VAINAPISRGERNSEKYVRAALQMGSDISWSLGYKGGGTARVSDLAATAAQPEGTSVEILSVPSNWPEKLNAIMQSMVQALRTIRHEPQRIPRCMSSC
jgi:hypothetical protein